MGNLRATGRTTRMLEYAVKQAKAGKRVVIYCDFPSLQNRLLEELVYLADGNLAQLPGNIVFDIINRNFDWGILKKQGVRSEIVALVDHATIERMYPAVTDMLYRFIT